MNLKRFLASLLLVVASLTCALPARSTERWPSPAVQSGLTVSVVGSTLSVQPGSAYVNDKLITIDSPMKVEMSGAPPGKLTLGTLYISELATVAVAQGVPDSYAPEPAPAPPNSLPLAHVLVRGGSPLRGEDVLPIIRDSSYDMFSDHEHNQKALSRTINKLKSLEPVRIMFLGDSVTYGAGASRAEHSFPRLVELFLKQHYRNPNVVVKIQALPGTRMKDHVEHLDSAMTEFAPDVVVIEFVNDIRTSCEYLDGLYVHVRYLMKKSMAEVVYVNPFLPSPVLFKAAFKGTLEQGFSEIAKRQYFQFGRDKSVAWGWALADCTKRWEQLPMEGLRPELLLQDGIVHPNNTGHQMVAEEIFKCFI